MRHGKAGAMGSSEEKLHGPGRGDGAGSDGFAKHAIGLSLKALLGAGIGTPVERRGKETASSLLAKVLGQSSLGAAAAADPHRAARALSLVIAQIDDAVSRQLNAILHHPEFQRLEASWRGIAFLHERMLYENREDLKLKVLDASWQELERDFRKQREFDQSHLFRCVYEEEFGQAGGLPFGVLVGDFEIRPRLSREYQRDDVAILRSIAEVAAAAFCPFIAATSPAMFDFRDFSRLERTIDLRKYFGDASFFRWRKLREEEDSRFIGLTLPRVLMRTPYADDPQRVDGFRFREDVEQGVDVSKYLWGSAAYAFADVLMRSFAQTDWFVDTRGVQAGIDGGGLVAGPALESFDTDSPGVALKPSTDVAVSENLELTLSELGFIPLCDCADTKYAAFYSCQSIQAPEQYSSSEATASARMSTNLQHMFCVSRFAHYLKVMARDLIGSLDTSELQRYLNDWIADYICDADASPETKAAHPLEDGRVQLVQEPGMAGAYRCFIQLKPHFEVEALAAAIRLDTRMSAVRPV